MTDFAYAYFNTELDKLPLSDLEQVFEKVCYLISQKRNQKTSKEQEAINKLAELADSMHLNSNGCSWTREELYER